jgi:two-component system, NarL family, nitrate/nitrite response regulator NarL
MIVLKPAHTILVVGNPLGSDLIEAYLKDISPPIEVAKATSVAQALAVLELPRVVNLVLLSLHPPHTEGLRAVQDIRERRPDIPVAVLCGETSAKVARAVLEAGVCGFISKRLQGPAFVAALRLVLAGEQYFPANLLHADVPRTTADGIAKALTPRELETLVHLSNGRSNKEIARAMNIKIVTVTLHLTNLYRKLGVSGRAQAVRRAVEAGLQASCR